MDAGEAPVAAAAREFREETGIVLDRARLTPVLDPRNYDGRHYFTVSSNGWLRMRCVLVFRRIRHSVVL